MKKLLLIALMTCTLICAKAQNIAGPSDTATPPPAALTTNVGKVFVMGQTITMNEDTTAISNALVSTATGWQWQWYKQNTTGTLQLSTITTNIYTETPTAPGWYYYDLAANNPITGCSSPASNLFRIYVAPVITATATSNIASECVGATTPLVLSANVTSATAGYTFSYQWQRNGVNIAGATNSTFTDPVEKVAGNIVFTCVIAYNWYLLPLPLAYSIQVSKTISIVAAVGKPGIK